MNELEVHLASAALHHHRRSHKLQSFVAAGVSTFVHVGLCIFLALVAFHPTGNGSHDGNSAIGVEFGADDGDSELSSLNEFDAPVEMASGEPNNSSVEIPSSLSDSLNNDNTDIAKTLSNAGVGSATSLADSAAIASVLGGSGGGGDGLANSGGGKAAESLRRTSFFGAEAHGDRFVFVIDSSKSMIGPRWEALCRELIRAIQSLSPDQEYFIISFDFEAHPMFGKFPPRGTFLKPEPENIKKTQRWVRSIIHAGATLPASSIGIAIRLKPDAIFLLSDGEINDSTLADLRVFNRVKDEDGEQKVAIPIHTVLLHSDAGYMTLKEIAEENDGTFTPVTLRGN